MNEEITGFMVVDDEDKNFSQCCWKDCDEKTFVIIEMDDKMKGLNVTKSVPVCEEHYNKIKDASGRKEE